MGLTSNLKAPNKNFVEIWQFNMAFSRKYLQRLIRGEAELFEALLEAKRLKERRFGDFIETCAITNAKSGRCASDCKFCAQSSFYQTGAPVYPLLPKEDLIFQAERAYTCGINRFSFVTSGIRLTTKEFENLLEVIRKVKKKCPGLSLCASLGQLGEEELLALKEAGLCRYHHNLECAQSFYPQISTRQRWEDRLKTAQRVKEVGLSLCCGGIFGLGETEEHVFEFAATLKDLSPDSVPVNFLHPIPGTPLEGASYLTPARALSILCVLRFLLPETSIRVCGGREYNLRDLQALALLPADSLMVGNYLTTSGRKLSRDRQMIADLGYRSTLKA